MTQRCVAFPLLALAFAPRSVTRTKDSQLLYFYFKIFIIRRFVVFPPILFYIQCLQMLKDS